ncbi:MAG: hypothetical protein ACE5IY_02520 [bacterium]
MNESNELDEARRSEIQRRIEQGFYFTRRIYEVIAEKVMKEIIFRKRRS